MSVRTLIDDLARLTAALPPPLQAAVTRLPADALLEIVLDLGRPPQARLVGGALTLSETPVDRAALDQVVDGVGAFGPDNRAGIEGTLHRIACLRNRRGDVVGLTMRVGRAVLGTVDLIRSYVERGDSLLLLGRPGVGKTTKLREVARLLADEAGKRVVIVDTSNEIGGDGDIPHPAIGSARRMQVPRPDRQHAVMIEAVENHMPEVIVIDEIGTADEALAARTIAERGVQLVATAHGNTLDNLLMNPTLSDLVGGVQTVVLGDEEAHLRGTQKTVRERRTTPTFGTVVEIHDRDHFVVHADTAAAVDRLLRGESAHGARIGAFDSETVPRRPSTRPAALRAPAGDRPLRIHAWAVSRDSVERVVRDLHLNARTVRSPQQADVVMALRSRSADPQLRRMLETSGVPLLEVKKNTTAQIRRSLQHAIANPGPPATDAPRPAAVDDGDPRNAKRERVPILPGSGPAARPQAQTEAFAMATDADPIVGNWYGHRTEKGQRFEVIAVDEDEGLVEVQHYDGDVESFDIDEWYEMDLDVIEAPENWTGPIDAITDEDLVYMNSDMTADEWKEPLQESRSVFRQSDEPDEPNPQPPIADERFDEEEDGGRDQRK